MKQNVFNVLCRYCEDDREYNYLMSIASKYNLSTYYLAGQYILYSYYCIYFLYILSI